MKILGIIPSRFASSRFPGKALANINGKSIIQRVFEQSQKSSMLEKVVVATDDQKIFDHVMSFNGNVEMTSADHRNGTERCLEALNKQKEDYDFVINIQGDEPFINPGQIDSLANMLDPNTEIATLAKKIMTEDELKNNNINKVVFNMNGDALYFSRSTIPFNRKYPESIDYYKHIGIYAYRVNILNEITRLEPTPLEVAEALEQLRWLENGYSIKVGITEIDSIGIDTPEDLERAVNLTRN